MALPSTNGVASTSLNFLEGRVAMVTGAGGGIGRVLCRRLVQAGCVVIGVDCRKDKLEELTSDLSGERGKLHAKCCDITNDELMEETFKQVVEMYGPVHLCINNAGCMVNKTLLDGSPEDWRKMLNLNVVATCLLTKLSVQEMRRTGVDDGHVINIGSLAGQQVPPLNTMNFYSATKFAVRAITEGLQQELRELKSGIRVSSISPGVVRSDMLGTSLGNQELATKVYDVTPSLDADDIAATVMHMVTAPAHVQIHDVIIRHTDAAW